MFEKFLNSLKTPQNASLIETIQKAYITCLESENEPKPETPLADDEKAWKTKFKVLWDGTQIFIVDGEYVRNNIAVKFIEGGHCLVYPEFIPKNEIWIEKMLSPHDEHFIGVHEIYEYTLMKYTGMNYDEAHDKADNVEQILRSIGSKDVPEFPKQP